jgi:hypothetical protein
VEEIKRKENLKTLDTREILRREKEEKMEKEREEKEIIEREEEERKMDIEEQVNGMKSPIPGNFYRFIIVYICPLYLFVNDKFELFLVLLLLQYFCSCFTLFLTSEYILVFFFF